MFYFFFLRKCPYDEEDKIVATMLYYINEKDKEKNQINACSFNFKKTS